MNYKEVAQAIKNNEPFRHNGTMTGIINLNSEMAEQLGGKIIYEIYSYKTLIYAENIETGRHWLNLEFYSNTTSRQRGLIIRAKGLIVEK